MEIVRCETGFTVRGIKRSRECVGMSFKRELRRDLSQTISYDPPCGGRKCLALIPSECQRVIHNNGAHRSILRGYSRTAFPCRGAMQDVSASGKPSRLCAAERSGSRAEPKTTETLTCRFFLFSQFSPKISYVWTAACLETAFPVIFNPQKRLTSKGDEYFPHEFTPH